MRQIKNRRLGIGIDRDDFFRLVHPGGKLNRAADAQRQDQFRFDRPAGQSDLPVNRKAAAFHQRTAAGQLRSQLASQPLNLLQRFFITDTAAHRHQHFGIRDAGLLRMRFGFQQLNP